MATLTTLVRFNTDNGALPLGNLLLDPLGNLFGTTESGGANGLGTIFEVQRSSTGYAATPTTLASLQTSTGFAPLGGPSFDANANLLVATTAGGANGTGTILLLPNTGSGYGAPAVLASSTAAQGALSTSLSSDAAGNLFGAASNGTTSGAVVELGKTGTGYAGTLATLGSFSTGQGAPLSTGLVLDPAGDIFGTTSGSGNGGMGSIFEIAKTAAGYASLPTVLASFTNTIASAALVIDSYGNLFGTTETGGPGNGGTVFELAKTAGGYASTLAILASFDQTSGVNPLGNLLIDAAGNLFGTTSNTVFEIAKGPTGYSTTPTALASFSGSDGQGLYSGLSVDASGNLFGTTSGVGSTDSSGTVFEITGSGFVVGQPSITGTGTSQTVASQATSQPFANVTITDLPTPVQTLTVKLSSAANGTLSNLGSGSYDAATGLYTASGTTDAVTADARGLVFTPAASNGGTTSTNFTITDSDGAGGTATDSSSTVISVAPNMIGAAVYRFYNPADEGHFFTSNPDEVAQIQASDAGLVLEGPAFNAVDPTNDTAAATVFRFYQPANNSHFYTDSVQEVQQVQATRPDMILEGPAFSVDPTMQPGDTAVYRLYETRSDTHLYTTSVAEIGTIQATRPDITLEGPAFYVKT